ncbi:hypothetical protein [Arthrobacter sp. ZGTC131]|uniref:hypothetical protein n=1 Tax=Arthrobacter sp. ZGTC131 TaxID=2058898 RepID=UPI002157C298|nr:hypothetical protein [Arthrobacter sp. ZGTC131]
MIPRPGLQRRPAPGVRVSATLAGCLLAVGLAGCAGPARDLEGNAAAQLQQRVLAVTTAAGSDPAAALKSLDGLSSELDAAAADGQVSFRRHQSITVAIDAVRADLTAAAAAKKAAAAKPATPTPTPTTPQAVAPEPAPAPAPGNSGEDSSGDDKSGSGGENGKGSGKGKD